MDKFSLSKDYFIKEYLEGNPWAARLDSTTGDFVLPAVQDAYAGWVAALTIVNADIELEAQE